MDKVRVKVVALAYNSLSKTGAYAMILANEEDTIRIPVIVGLAEAQAIAMRMKGLKVQRPFTHDMVKALTDRLNVRLEEVCIYQFLNGIFYSEAVFRKADGEEIRLDIRTSDAVALALRYGSPIYMERSIMKVVGISTEVFERKWLQQPGGGERRKPAPAELSEEELNRLMEEAVEKEDYETASRYRDMLTARKEK